MLTRKLSSALKICLIAGVLLSVVGSMFMPHSAAAAGETYRWDGNDIVGSAGDFNILNATPKTPRFTHASGADSYEAKQTITTGGRSGGTTCTVTYALTGVTATTGTIAKKSSTGTCGSNLSGAVTITGTAPSTIPNTTTGGGTTTSEGDPTSPDCESNGGGLPLLIMCPVIDGIVGFSDWIFEDVIQPLIRTKPVDLSPDSVIYKIWSSFRVYGNIILVIALLFAVFGQSINAGIFEAYAARKMLPRILIAAICINLSIYIVALGVDISHIIGFAVGDLIIAPVRDSGLFNFTPSGIDFTAGVVAFAGTQGIIGAFVALIIFGGGLGPIAVWIALFVLLPAVLTVVGIFVTVVLLHGITFTLVIVSPVAFALYCLPNTEKYTKVWWDWLQRVLAVYPIIMIIFAIANVLSVAVNFANDTGGNKSFTAQSTNLVAGIVSFLLLFIPLAMIPFAFKLAGGLIGRINDLIAGYKSKTAEAVKGNPQDPDSMRNLAKKNLRGSWVQARAQVYRGLDKPGAGRVRSRLARLAASGNVLAKEAELNAAAKERIFKTKGSGDDAILNARTATQDPDGVWRTLDGKEVTEAQRALAKKFYRTMPEIQAIEEYRETKTNSTEEAEAFTRRFGQLADQEGWSEEELASQWISTGFARQDERGEFKHGSWSRDPATGKRRFTKVGARPATPGDLGSSSFYESGRVTAAQAAEMKAKGLDDGEIGRKRQGKADAFLTEQYYKKGSYRGSAMLSSYFDSMKELKAEYLKRVKTSPAGSEERDNAKERLRQILEIEEAFEYQQPDYGADTPGTPPGSKFTSRLSGASAGTVAQFEAMKATGKGDADLDAIRAEIKLGRRYDVVREERRRAAPGTYVP